MMAIEWFDDIVDELRERFAEPPCAYTPFEVCGPVADKLRVGADDVQEVIDSLLTDGSLRHASAGSGLLVADPAWLFGD